MSDHPPCYLVRMLFGRRRALVLPLVGEHRSRFWYFKHGVAVVNPSLSEALELASELSGRPDDES